ncbi:sigma-70 family RNA polymerase sigma factor [Peribacillus asahii]|uniref:sigma-70 family RNA polymerase sigma factor n=1 Tax=Peribacillus TaxID=2675229 RepID=UPI0035CB9609
MDELVVERLQAGEGAVLLDEIMEKYGQDILQLVYSYVKEYSLAEDLTQEIFVKCYRALPTYKKQAGLRTWLWKIAINHCKDYLKSWYHRNVDTISENLIVASNDSVEREIIRRDDDQALAESVMDLPIIYREAIYLYYFQELTIKEIAEMTGIKQGTIKTRLRKAKEILKTRLEGFENGR